MGFGWENGGKWGEIGEEKMGFCWKMGKWGLKNGMRLENWAESQITQESTMPWVLGQLFKRIG